jgi:C-terminal processing protease CtpA/Prc
LQRLVAAHVCRFIVDLRANTGGGMYPMINAVDALLGDGTLGYWQITGQPPDEPWPNTFGQYGDAASVKRIDSLKNAPVAILIGALTASAGEFTAMAFEGRPNTRFFGETTADLISANEPIPLPDGALLVVSEGWGTDRLHRPYRSAIVPDEATPRGQATLDAAIAWLKKQPCPTH